MRHPSQNAMVDFTQTFREHGSMRLQSMHYQAPAQGRGRRHKEDWPHRRPRLEPNPAMKEHHPEWPGYVPLAQITR